MEVHRQTDRQFSPLTRQNHDIYLVDTKREQSATRKIGRDRRISVNIPNEFTHLMDESSRKAIDVVENIPIIEYDSYEKGPLLFLTTRMHGEEAKGRVSLDYLEDFLEKRDAIVTKGKILEFKILNPPGCNDPDNLHRYVFDDESDTNLNNEFDKYKEGTWQEFFSLKRKTQKVAWLIMKHMKNESVQYREIFGEAEEILHIDSHREEGIPVGRIDRLYEQKDFLETTWNTYLKLGLPICLENEILWYDIEDGFTDSFTANTGKFAQSQTLEEGNTKEFDQDNAEFIAYMMVHLLLQKGMIELSDSFSQEILRRIQYLINNGRKDELQKTAILAQHQRESGNIYQLAEIHPSINLINGSMVSPIKLLEQALRKPKWDGIIKVKYDINMIGRRVDASTNTKFAEIQFGQVQPLDTNAPRFKADAVLNVPTEYEDIWIISRPESPIPEMKHIEYALYFNKKRKTVELNIVGDEYEGKPYKPHERLNRNQILQYLSAGNKLDMDALDLQCAIPDKRWSGEKQTDGYVLFSAKS